jgi:hypothetical protein
MDGFESIVRKIPNWIRWLLIPITAVVTAVVVWFVAGILAKILVFFDGGRGWSENFFQYLLIPGFGSYYSVVASTAMAPKFKQFTALLFGAAWAFAAGALTFISILTATWASLIAVASVCVGCGIAAIALYNDPEKWSSESNTLPEPSTPD